MSKKSHATNLVLTVLLGPLGLLYASAWQAVILIIVALFVIGAGSATGGLVIWGLSIALGVSAVSTRNSAISAQEAKDERRHQELVQAASGRLSQ